MVVYWQRLNRILSHLLLFIDDVSAVLRLDNVEIGQTQWKSCGPQCWGQLFTIDVERVCYCVVDFNLFGFIRVSPPKYGPIAPQFDFQSRVICVFCIIYNKIQQRAYFNRRPSDFFITNLSLHEIFITLNSASFCILFVDIYLNMLYVIVWASGYGFESRLCYFY